MKKVILNDAVKSIVAKQWKEKESTVKLSNTTKLGVKSWSLQALNTCPASINESGELVDACKGCYATSGNYRYNNARSAREFNRKAWKEESFINDFVLALQNERFFRWFDSGDMYSQGLAEKIYKIMELTPHVQHWLPTRMHKFSKFVRIIQKMNALNNVVVRLSSDSIKGDIVESEASILNSTIIHPSQLEGLNKEIFVCTAPENEGKCLECKACYSKEIKTIAYIGHGQSMKKNQIKIFEVA